ncbi:MAG: thiol-activated cytolysin family protein [Deltaproteobacteria bacterium]|nr:thiol-activated cytolysin family protein [Deltaproteobacteria bacterium]
MTHPLGTTLPFHVLALFGLLGCAGCLVADDDGDTHAPRSPAPPSAPDAASPSVSPTPPTRPASADVASYFATLPLEWPAPPEDADATAELPVDVGTDEGVQFECSRTQHDVQRSFESVLALGDAYADVRPGMLLQGARFRDGVMMPVPLRRGPLDLSIDLAVSAPTAHVNDPNSATLQTAIARLQREADAELGTLPNLPARISYSNDTASSYREAVLDVGVHGAYDGALRSASLDADLSTSRSRRSVTVVARLFQPMYTISIADDALPTEADFLAPGVTRADLETQQAAGTIGPDNLPVYVKSVTYGRLVIFTMTSVDVQSSTELSALVSASFGNFEADAALRTRYREVASRSQLRVLALGGPADTATTAVQTGDYTLFFGPASASTAVPLSYRVHYLRGARPIARIGDTLSYVTEQCDYRTPTTERIALSGVVREAAGSTAPWSTGVELRAGDRLQLQADGEIWAGVWLTGCNGPEGWSTTAPSGAGWPLPGARRHSLLVRVGRGPWHYVGRTATFDSRTLGTGLIQLGTNDDVPGNGNDCDSASRHGFHVRGTIERTIYR